VGPCGRSLGDCVAMLEHQPFSPLHAKISHFERAIRRI